MTAIQLLKTPRPDDLGLRRLSNPLGFEISLLPNGALFAMQHRDERGRIMINRTFGSPVGPGMARLCARVGGNHPAIVPLAHADACCRQGATAGKATASRFVWQGEALPLAHQVTLQLQRTQSLWLWRVVLRNSGASPIPCDIVHIQDLGLGDPGFLMNNEAYASQYLDHHIVWHPRMGPVLMGRQNLAQGGRNPWVAHGCLEGAVGYATDFCQLMGPAHRDAGQFAIPFGTRLASVRLQHEAGCAALQSAPVELAPGATAIWTFFGLFRADHPEASGDADLALVENALGALDPPGSGEVELAASPRSVLIDAPPAAAEDANERWLQECYPQCTHMERRGTTSLSFFMGAGTDSRHVVLRAKERHVLRRHGALLVSGGHLLPDERILCVTCWMHGVFAAQLTLGNTSFHRLWSVSRDPYNITRDSGLRILVDAGDGWRLLTVPSIFEMGLADCRWIYRLGGRTVTVSAVVGSAEPVVQWRVTVVGAPCRFLVFGQLVIGEQELAQAAELEIDAAHRRFRFRPEPGGLWSQRYPAALYCLVTSTPDCIEALGSDELLYSDGQRRTGGYAVLQTRPTQELVFAVVGSLTDPREAEALATWYSSPVSDASMQAAALSGWRALTRGIRIATPASESGVQALDTVLPWMVHDAMVHLAVPHGLEQFTGGAWGTRDVCQGPMEMLLALEHDAAAREILRIVFAQQYAASGDWPQWFMLEPYSAIQAREAHGDVIVWPLKALCDYTEATGDFAILEERVPWRREDDLERTAATDSLAAHVEKLISTVRERFVPGTHLIRLGNGDWNDSLQPVDPRKREWMVSSWTVALLYEQLCRYAGILRRSGRSDGAAERSLAAAMRADLNRFLIREGTIAGYGEFHPEGGLPELLLHPADRRTGIRSSLLPMTQGILGGVFTPEQVRHHLDIIRRELAFPDGVRLMDRPPAYHGGPQLVFQRAESAAFFGREIGLMYTHAHLRHAQALALLGEAQEMWEALLAVNPIAVTDRVPQATLRQRNAYFSSSDAAFLDRYQASSEWARVRAGTIAVDGGWRIYSSGPGLYMNVLIRHAFGVRRRFGTRSVTPCLPASFHDLRLEWDDRPAFDSPPR
ncbi:MAG: cellobiose phosphorylase [Gammaproteobacteria bacterium]|nr:cellobiose phosphorylase [Gammaproteobacteria bacterium]